MAWGSNSVGWWGEGEIKFYLDGDGEFPTICGTGTEDYFCGSYNFDPGNPGIAGMANTKEPLPRVYHALCRHAPGHQSRRRLFQPDALRSLPVAHHRSRTVREDLRITMQALAGAAAADICRFRMTLQALASGIRRCQRRRSPPCRIGITWR